MNYVDIILLILGLLVLLALFLSIYAAFFKNSAGPTGPTGPTGPVGPVGPTGPAAPISTNAPAGNNVLQPTNAQPSTTRIFPETFDGQAALYNINNDQISGIPISVTESAGVVTVTIPEFNFETQNNYLITSGVQIPKPITRYINFPCYFNLNKKPSNGFVGFKCDDNDNCNLAIVNIYSGPKIVHNFSGISFTYKSA